MYEYAFREGGRRMVDLRGRDFLKLLDFTPKEIEHLLKTAVKFKKMKHEGTPHNYLKGKQIAIIFEKDSTRTRCSFEVGAKDLGMEVTYLGPTGSQLGKKETIADTARVLAGIYDGIEYRGFEQAIVQELADYSKVPVWNGLTNEFHPTQMLADVMTIKEEFGSLKGKKLVFCGDARNNVGNSLMVVSSKLGMNFTCCAPKELFPEEDLVKTCKEICKETGGSVTLTEDIEFSLKRIIKGRRLGWATDAIVYDEQPVSFKASWSQRSRWTVGHIQCLKVYTKDLALAVKKNKTMMNLDGLLYMMGSIPLFVVTILLLLSNFIIYASDAMTTQELISNVVRYVVPTFFMPIATAVFTMYLEKKPIKPMARWLIYYPLFLGSWLVINFKCLFKRNTTWEKIEHVRDIKIKEIA